MSDLDPGTPPDSTGAHSTGPDPAERTDPTGLDPAERTDRTRSLAFGLLAVGGLVGLVTAGRPWWVGTADGSTVTFSGTESTGGLAQAVPFVVFAGTLLALALRATGRRVLGVVMALAALGGVVAGILRPSPPQELVLTRLQTVTLGDRYQLATSAWPFVYAVGALLAGLGAAVMVVRAGGWLSRADRFERTAAEPAVPAAEQSDAALWSAIDAGLDPTDPPPVDGPARPSDASGPGSDGSEAAPIRTSSDDGVRMSTSAPRPFPTGFPRPDPPRGADGSAAPVAGHDVLDTGMPTATQGRRHPGSEGETR